MNIEVFGKTVDHLYFQFLSPFVMSLLFWIDRPVKSLEEKDLVQM